MLNKIFRNLYYLYYNSSFSMVSLRIWLSIHTFWENLCTLCPSPIDFENLLVNLHFLLIFVHIVSVLYRFWVFFCQSAPFYKSLCTLWLSLKGAKVKLRSSSFTSNIWIRISLRLCSTHISPTPKPIFMKFGIYHLGLICKRTVEKNIQKVA